MKLNVLFALLLAITSCTARAQSSAPVTKAEMPELPAVTVAIVRDGDSWYIDKQLADVKSALTQLASTKVQVTYKETPDFTAAWSRPRAAEALRAALVDPEVDYVLLQGFLVMDAASRAEYTLPKPVVGGFLQEPDVIGYMIDDAELSVRENLNIVVSNHRISEDMNRFKELVDFSTLYVLSEESYLENLDFIQEYLDELEDAVKAKTVYVGMGESAQEVLDKLPPAAQAIYLFPPMRMNEMERRKLVDGINAKGIPSFAYFGEPAVRDGILGGSIPDISQQLARRTALNIQRIILGESPNTVPTVLRTTPKLYLNALTAQKIGYEISFETAQDAEVLFQDEVMTGDPIDMIGAIERALKYNFQYLSTREDTKVSYEDRRLAISPLLPQVYAGLGYSQVDAGTVRSSGGATSKTAASAGVNVSQIIYNDERFANLEIAGENYQATALLEEAIRLDIVQLTAVAYIQYLSAVSLEKIARDNLAVTRRNLELARIRERVGTGGREEVFRFEAAEASDRSTVASAKATVEQSLVTLNQVLGEDLNTRWVPEDLTLDSTHFRTTSQVASDFVSTASRYERFRLFSLQYGVGRSPEVEALEHQIQGQEISLDQKQRAFYVPDVSANFNYTNTFHRSSEYNPPLPPDDNAWQVTVEAELPIFEGGSRVFDVIRQKSVVRSLQYVRDLRRQQVQQRILNALYALGASYANIAYSQIAADRANRNLEIVTEKYQQGTVNNIDLIDAQNEAFTQRQNEVLAIYGFLEDLVDYMRAINYYEFYAEPGQRESWFQQAQRFVLREERALAP